MSFPQLGYQYIRPIYPSDRQGSGGSRSGTELTPSGALSNVLSSMYGAPYAAAAAAQGYGAFLPYTAELPIFPQLGAQYELKDGPGVQHPAFPHHHPAFYPYGQYQFGDPSRPKNATRESTSTLKAWLNEHRKNPYPTKGEKIMLAIITKMTLTQVSTWFANARRRLKKENKMTWPPRNKCSEEKRPYEEEEEEESQEDNMKSEKNEEPASKEDKELELSDLDDFDPMESESSECEMKPPFPALESGQMRAADTCAAEHCKEPALKMPIPAGAMEEDLERAKNCLKSVVDECEQDLIHARQRGCESKMCFQPGQQILETKPRIWSLAHTATSLNQTEFPSCMLKRQAVPSSAAVSAPVGVIDRHQDSPVTNLRNWVDGVFHDPIFRHSTLNQALSNTTVSWATTKGAILETGSLGRSVGNSASVLKGQLATLSHQDSSKDFLAFPKSGSKMFCS